MTNPPSPTTVPPRAEPSREMEALLRIMAILRTPEIGCPWDLEQSFETIAPYTIEEAYEVADAIARRDMADLRDELGDLLLQAVYHAQMAAEADAFDFGDVVEALTAKLIRRHPHVFESEGGKDAAAVKVSWEAIKAAERAAKPDRKSGKEPSALDGVPLALPALMRAEKLQKRAARVGFDWQTEDGPLEKIAEEVREVKDAVATGDANATGQEIGDLLFSVVNYARHLGVDPETALRRANERFDKRFRAMETDARAKQLALADLGIDELEALWRAAKKATPAD